MSDPRRTPGGLLVAFCSLGILSACATPQDRVQDKENNLVAAGFVARPANTPERQAMLQRLRPNHFAQRQVKDGYVYLYPDPLVCDCLYVGSAQAYSQYKQNRLQKRLADEQETTAEMYTDPGWDFGPWGGPFGPGYGGGFGPGFY